MNQVVDHVGLAEILKGLRRSLGDIEFGYRMQACLAHVFLRLGGTIKEIKAQGHPDIVAELWGQRTLLEVEVASATRRNHTIKSDDLTAIKPVSDKFSGYLAVLDCSIPVTWLLIDYKRAQRQGVGTVSLVTLHAIAHRELSQQCTEEFAKLISQNKNNLPTLTFRILCARALRGRDL